MPVSKRVADMPVSAIRKLTPYVSLLQERGTKIYHLNIGDPDVPTPDCFIEALHGWTANPIRYAPSLGEPSFLEALLWYYHRLGAAFIERKNLVATVGGSEALVMTLISIAEVGEEVLVFEPFYSNYAVCAAIAGVKLVAVPTEIVGGFHLPGKATIEKYISPKTKGILFCSPGNPTGTVYTKAEIELLVKLAKERDLFLISDEVYREYVFDGLSHESLLPWMQEIPEQAILVDSLSKRYSLCGARLGVAVTLNEELLKGLTKMAQSRLSGGFIDQVVGAELTKVPDSYMAGVVVEYQKRRDILYAELTSIPGVTTYKPDGAFYTMAALPVANSDAFCEWLLDKYESNKETVMLAPGAGFYQSPGRGTNEVRIAYVLNEEKLRRSLAILKGAITKYQSL